MKERIKNIVNTFTIDGQTFSVILTKHAELRLSQRNIDQFQAIGLILSLGKERILSYINSEEDIMIIDKVNNFSVCVAITDSEITIITVINNADIWVKEGTKICNLELK